MSSSPTVETATWSELPRSTRRAAKRLAGQGKIHPDPGVTAAVYRWRQNRAEWGLAVSIACLAVVFAASASRSPIIGFAALGASIAAQLWMLAQAWAMTEAAIALAYDDTARRVLPFVVAGSRGFRPAEITGVAALCGMPLFVILLSDDPPEPTLVATTVLLALFAGGLLAQLLVRPRRGEPLATIKPDGAYVAHLDLWIPWSAVSDIEIDGQSVRWRLRDPKGFRRLTGLRGLRRAYWRLRIALDRGALVLPLGWMQAPAEALHRVPWGLGTPAPVDHDETVTTTRRS